MKLRSNFAKKIFSVILSLTVVTSAMLPFSLTALAGAGGSGATGGYSGSGCGTWYVTSNDQDIIKISASKIDNDTGLTDMDNFKIRYGDLSAFPILMMVGDVQNHSTSFTSAAFTNTTEMNKITASNGWLKTEADNWQNYKRGNYVPTPYEYQGHLDGTSKIIKYVASGDSSSVYIEDCLSAVYTNYKLSKLSLYDTVAFWYFYTRMAYGANDDNLEVSGSYTRGTLGETLNKVITNGSYGYTDENKHELMLKHGYIVALACIYGFQSQPVKTLVGTGGFKSAATENAIEGGTFDNNYVSLLVDRMGAFTVYTSGDGSSKAPIAFTPFDYYCAFKDKCPNKYSSYCISYGYANDIPQREYKTLKKDHHLAGWDDDITAIANAWDGVLDDIYPKRDKDIKNPDGSIKLDRYVTIDNSNKLDKRYYGGWGFFPLKPDETLVEKIKLDKQEFNNIATEVTYNAYLSDGTTLDDTSIAERASFSANSHVMTDTVYLSDVVPLKDIYGNGENDILSKKNGREKTYLRTAVEKSITLSAPVEKTVYNLARMQYQITNAGGEYSSYQYNDNSDDQSNLMRTLMKDDTPYTATSTQLNNGIISVKGDDILYAIGRGNETSYSTTEHPLSQGYINGVWKPEEFRSRGHNRLSGDAARGLECGIYSVNGSNNTYKYEIYYYDNNGKRQKAKVKENGRERGATSADVYNYCKTGGVTWTASGSISKQSKAYFGKYSSGDIDGNSKNLFQIKTEDGFYWFTCENGVFYYCPLVTYRNLLVQIKADYVATFAEKLSNGSSNPNYANTFQTVTMPEYLITQNVSSDDYTKKTMYSMIDLYNTNTWGSLTHSSAITYGDDGNDVSLPVSSTSARGVKKYSPAQNRLLNMFGYRITWSPQINFATDNFSSDVKKMNYVWWIDKSRPGFNLLEADDSTTKTSIEPSVSVISRKFNTNNLVTNSDTIVKDGNLRWTQAYAIGGHNADDSYIREGPGTYKIGDGVERTYYVTAEGSTMMCGSPSNVDLTRENGTSGIIYETQSGVSMIRGNNTQGTYHESYFTKMLTHYVKYTYESKSNTSAAPALAAWVGAAKTGFDSQALPKSMVDTTSYKGYIRFGQTGVSSDLSDTVTNAYLYRTLKNHYNSHGTAIDQVETYSVSGDEISAIWGSKYSDKVYTFAAPLTQGSYDIPMKYKMDVYSAGEKYKKAIGTTFAQSGNEISMSYQYSNDSIADGDGLCKFTSTDAYGVGRTTYSNWELSKVSLGIYPEVRMWAEKELGRRPNSSSDYTSVETVGTQKRYIPAMTYSTVKFNDLKVKANVLGTAVAYDTRAKKLASSLGTADTQVLYSGSALTGSVESTAGGKVQTYVFHFQGGGVLNNIDIKTAWDNQNYNPTNVASKAMSVLLSKFKVDSAVNMGIYNGRNYNDFDIKLNGASGSSLTAGTPVQDEVYYQVYIKGGRVDNVVSKMKVKKANGNTDYISLVKYNFKNYNGTANSVGVATNYRNINTSWTTQYNALSQTYKAKVTSYLNKAASDSRTDTIAVLKNMKLIGTNNLTSGTVISGAFEYGSGVDLPNGLKNSTGGTKSYNEDCSVLQVLSYTANISSSAETGTFTEQLPINLGPETPKNKNDYFSNGYKGFINASVAIKTKEALGSTAANTTIANASVTHNIKGETGTVSIPITGGSSTASAKLDAAKKAVPDFIIGDVPISEALSG